MATCTSGHSYTRRTERRSVQIRTSSDLDRSSVSPRFLMLLLLHGERVALSASRVSGGRSRGRGRITRNSESEVNRGSRFQLAILRIGDNPTGTRKSHLRRARMRRFWLKPLSRIPFSLPSLRCARPIRQIVQECFPPPPLAGVYGMDLRLLYVQYLAHDDHQNFNFLFRLC
jgi:hypothetical protein